MKWCNCIKCGGTDEFAFCENGMMNAWEDYHTSSRRLEWILGAVVVLFILIFCLG